MINSLARFFDKWYGPLAPKWVWPTTVVTLIAIVQFLPPTISVFIVFFFFGYMMAMVLRQIRQNEKKIR